MEQGAAFPAPAAAAAESVRSRHTVSCVAEQGAANAAYREKLSEEVMKDGSS
jgi:hypothetical protein